MSTELAWRTWQDVVRSVAWDVLGQEISYETADWFLWEHTGFPSFWDIPGVSNFRMEQRFVVALCEVQLREAFARVIDPLPNVAEYGLIAL